MMMKTRFKELRKERDLTQERLGEILGISQQAINKYERGLAAPTNDRMQKLCDFFHCSADYLMGRSDVRAVVPAGEVAGDKEEDKLMAYYRSMNVSDKKRLMYIAESFIEMDGNESKGDSSKLEPPV